MGNISPSWKASWLATRLLERNTRRQSLTDAGRVYFDEAKRVMEQVSIAESAVERLRLAPAGTLRVSAPTSFGASVIAPLTATFLQAGGLRSGWNWI